MCLCARLVDDARRELTDDIVGCSSHGAADAHRGRRAIRWSSGREIRITPTYFDSTRRNPERFGSDLTEYRLHAGADVVHVGLHDGGAVAA